MTDWKRLLDDNARRALEVFERRCGTFGDLERRSLPFTDGQVEVRDSGEGSDAYTVKGHAAVFNRKSLDLGGFQEIIAPGAFDNVLDRTPHVLLLWDHDTRYQLASTKTNRLELRVDPRGLYFWARVVGSTSHARDLRYLMDAGEVDQASFAFTVARDTWEIKNEGKDKETVLRTIEEVAELFDVTVTAMGAYPQTDTSVVRAYAMNYAADTGRLPTDEDRESPGVAETPETPVDVPDDVAPDEPAGDIEESSHQEVDDPSSHPDEGVDGEQGRDWNRSQTAPPLLRAARFGAHQATEYHRHLLKETQRT